MWTARPTAGELAVVVLARVQVATEAGTSHTHTPVRGGNRKEQEHSLEVSGDRLQVHEVAEPSPCAFPITRKDVGICLHTRLPD